MHYRASRVVPSLAARANLGQACLTYLRKCSPGWGKHCIALSDRPDVMLLGSMHKYGTGLSYITLVQAAPAGVGCIALPDWPGVSLFSNTRKYRTGLSHITIYKETRLW